MGSQLIKPGTTIGPVEIGNRIGGGGMGDVYEGYHLRLEIRVTVKIIKAELVTDRGLVRRFLQEAQLAASLRHPNIVRIYDVDLHNGLPFYVMELLVGNPLDALLAHQGQLILPQAVSIALQMAEALAHAHHLGVIHRDIKPDNVVVDARNRAVLTDFGLALLHRAKMRLTEPGTPVGTPDYASPEQLAGAATVDGRSDLYSLGVVLYELVTGELPFPDQDSLQKVLSRLEALPRPMAERRATVPAELDALVLRLMQPNPELRYSSGEEVAAQLRRIQELPGMADLKEREARVISPATGQPVGTRIKPLPEPPQPPRPSHLRLPREGDGPLLEGHPLAQQDLVALLRSFASNTRHGAGYMLLTYLDSSDLVLYENGRPQGCFRFDGQRFVTIRGNQVLQRARVQQDARIDSYLISHELMQVLRISLTWQPMIKGLRGSFVRFQGFLNELAAIQLEGFVRLYTGQAYSFLVFRGGRLERAYLAGELLTSCQRDPLKEIAHLIEHTAVPVTIDVFPFAPDPAETDASGDSTAVPAGPDAPPTGAPPGLNLVSSDRTRVI